MYTWRHLLWLLICAGMISGILYAYAKKRPGLDRVLTTALLLYLFHLPLVKGKRKHKT
ncbi:MAG: hypothetical protein IJR95_02790 [Lachnospiraceae bacterium]|nr:hypothetical protein [Lachnospiraceae bacterium]